MNIDELSGAELEMRFRLIQEGFSTFADVVKIALKHAAEAEGVDPERLIFRRSLDWTFVQIGDRPLLKFKELVILDESNHWRIEWVISKEL